MCSDIDEIYSGKGRIAFLLLWGIRLLSSDLDTTCQQSAPRSKTRIAFRLLLAPLPRPNAFISIPASPIRLPPRSHTFTNIFQTLRQTFRVSCAHLHISFPLFKNRPLTHLDETQCSLTPRIGICQVR